MVTLSLTPFRTAEALRRAADDLEAGGWDPEREGIIAAIDRVTGYTRPGDPEEGLMLAAWDALGAHLDEPLVHHWEQVPGRTVAEVLAMLRACADGLVTR